MESKYAMDEFWLQKLDFKRKVDASSFTSLHEARALVNNIFLLVVRNNLGAKELSVWQENLIFLEYLVENLGNHSHGWAMQKLKEEFGGQRGMSARRKKLADKIVRETPQRTMPQLPSGPVLQLPPPPQQFFGGGLGMMAPTHPVPFGPPSFNHQPLPSGFNQQPLPGQGGQQPPRPFGGVCFLCQQSGHMARYCPFFPGQRPAQNRKPGPKRFGKRRS
jgi:hypothetical protein